MAIEFFLIAVAIVLFGGMFIGLLLSYRESEVKRASAAPPKAPGPPALYGWEARSAALAEEMMLRQIEHYLRRESMLAEQFVMDPSPRTLRAGDDVRLGAH